MYKLYYYLIILKLSFFLTACIIFVYNKILFSKSLSVLENAPVNSRTMLLRENFWFLIICKNKNKLHALPANFYHNPFFHSSAESFFCFKLNKSYINLLLPPYSNYVMEITRKRHLFCPRLLLIPLNVTLFISSPVALTKTSFNTKWFKHRFFIITRTWFLKIYSLSL